MLEEVPAELPGKAPCSTAGVVVGLLVIMTLAAGVRAAHVAEPMWLDELHTAWVIEGDLGDVTPRAAAGNQGPVYYYIGWLLRQLGGREILVYRGLSLMAGLVLVPVMFFVVREACQSDWAGWVAAILVSVDRFSVVFSCEARPYSCVQLFVVIHLYLGWIRLAGYRNAEPSWRCRLGWVMTGGLLFYLHYTTALILAAELMVLLWSCRSRIGAHLKRATGAWLDVGMLVVACCPALPHVIMIGQRRHSWSEFVPEPSFLSLLMLVPVVPYVLVPLAAWLIDRWRPGHLEDLSLDREWLMILSGALGLPVVVAWATTRMGWVPLYWPRYLVGSSTAAIVIAATLVSTGRDLRFRGIVTSALVGLVLLTESAISFSPVLPGKTPWPFFLHRSGIAARQERWEDVIAYVNERDPRGNWPVFLAPDLIEDRGLQKGPAALLAGQISIEEFCLFPVQGGYQLRSAGAGVIPLASTPATLPAGYRQLVERAGGAWFLVRGKEPRIMAWQQVARELPCSPGETQLVRVQRFGNLGLIRLERFQAPP